MTSAEVRPSSGRRSGPGGCAPPLRCGGWSPDLPWRRVSWCCRSSSAQDITEPCRSARCRGPAHALHAAGRGHQASLGLGGFGSRPRDAVGSGATDPNGILNLRDHRRRRRGGDALGDERPVPGRVHRPRSLRCAHLRRPGRQPTTLGRTPTWPAPRRTPVSTVGPSGTMDGQVAVIRKGLDAAEHTDVSILAYSAEVRVVLGPPARPSALLAGGRPPPTSKDAPGAVEGVPRGLDVRRRARTSSWSSPRWPTSTWCAPGPRRRRRASGGVQRLRRITRHARAAATPGLDRPRAGDPSRP